MADPALGRWRWEGQVFKDSNLEPSLKKIRKRKGRGEGRVV